MYGAIETLQRKGFGFFLQRYLGQYLKEKLTIDQLTISILNGTATITDLLLDMKVLNEMADKYNLPIEFVEGSIKNVTISIPWKNLLNESCFVEVKGLSFAVQPKHRSNTVSVMDSIVGSVMMTSSYASSLQLAKECIGKEEPIDNNERESENIAGLDIVAQHIEAIFSRIKVRLWKTSLKLLYAPKGSKSGTALNIMVEKIDYCQEVDTNNSNFDAKDRTQNDQTDAYTCKNFLWEGVSIYMEEFSSDNSSFLIRSSVFMECDNKVSDPYSTAPDTPEPVTNSDADYDERSFSFQSSPSNTVCPPTPILIAKLQGRNDVRLKLKNCDTVNGPTVLAEFNLGSAIIFLSPIQLHLIGELFGEFISPSFENISPVSCKDIIGNKPMQLCDFNLIQRELQQQATEPLKDHSLFHHQGWSSQCLEDSDEEFLPFNASNRNRAMSNSIFSNASDGSQSFISTGKPYVHGQGAYNLKGEDVSVETSHFKLQISSIVVIILHEDILTASPLKNGQMVSSSVFQMQSRAEKFFNDLGTFSISPNTDKCLDQCHTILNNIIKTNHLRFISSPCTVDILDTTSSDTKNLETVLLFGLSDLVECLYSELTSSLSPGHHYYHVLKFEQFVPNMSKSCSNLCSLSTAQTSIKVKINYTDKLLGSTRKYLDVSSRFEVEFSLAPCTFEIDISIIDRISCLLNPKELHRKTHPNIFVNGYNDSYQFTTGNSNIAGHCLDLKLNSPSLTLKIRFPIPDLRSLSDMNRAPWWKQTIRKDSMLLLLNDARLHTIFNNENSCSFFEIRCKELLASFQENPSNPATEFLRASVGNDVGNAVNNEIGWPRLSFKINHPITQSIFEESEREDDSNSELGNSFMEKIVHELLNKNKATAPSLFTYRKIAPKNAECKNKQHSPGNDSSENEEHIHPGDRKDANEFFEWANSCSHFVVDISLENLEIFIPSKHFYEILYNRITVDLLLWEPAAIVPPPVKDNTSFFSVANNFNWDSRVSSNNNAGFQTFSLCRTALKRDSGSDSDDDTHPNFTTCNEQKSKLKKNFEPKNKLNGLQNKISLTVNVKNVCLQLNLPYTDPDGVVDSEYEGKLLVIATDACFSTLVTAEESPVTTYISLHANNAEVYHKSRTLAHQYDPNVTLASNEFFVTDSIKCRENLILHVTENKAKPDLTTPVGSGGDSLDALSLVIRSSFEPVRNVKNFRMALGISGSTLHYYMARNYESWFAQIVDFFDVIDYPVTGYQPPEIVTELHLHAWGCAIDYRPIYLPLRVFLTMGSFSVSSNIVAGTSISLVRFRIEDVYFFLSRECNASSVNLLNDYVCLMDTDLFELILRNSDGKNLFVPKIDLQAFSNTLYIRTCADSCIAIQDLLQYFANDGDLQVIDQDTDDEEPASGDLNTLVNDIECQVVNAMMEEAMQDTQDEIIIKNDIENPNRKIEKPNCDLFLFPGETEGTPENESPNLYPCISKELGFTSERDESFDSLEDFCILEELPEYYGISPKSDKPVVVYLTDEPIQIVENHFYVPLKRFDNLRSPKHFPPTVNRYALKEMTIKWLMYGGNDFPSVPNAWANVNNRDVTSRRRELSESDKETRTTNVRYEMSNRNYANITGVSFSKAKHEVSLGCGGDYSFVPTRESDKKKPISSSKLWIANGGQGRQYEVLVSLLMDKVRFQHESYIETAAQASRQVLLINDIEMVDQLAASQIHILLTQYHSENMPKQSHADMITIKAVHRRCNPDTANQECDLKVAILPLKLNIDQDAYIFLSEFFGKVAAKSEDCSGVGRRASDFGKNTKTVSHHPPIMNVGKAAAASSELLRTSLTRSDSSGSQNNLIQLDDTNVPRSRSGSISSTSTTSSISSPIFFSSFEFTKDVLIRLDYQGKHYTGENGPLLGFLLGFAQLNCSELVLKKSSHRGVLGFDRLMNDVINEWMQDIKMNQIPSLLAGVGPLHSFVQLFNGFRDLIWLPIEQYKKDGRIVRGLQRGANAFTSSTTIAILEIASRLVGVVQSTAETAYDVVNPGPSVRCRRDGRRGKRRVTRKPHQSGDLMEGVTNAYHVVKEGLTDTATTIVRVASYEHEEKGISGAVGGVLRQLPSAVVKPLIIATEATCNVLDGMKHQLAPDVRREAAEKWRAEN